MKNILIKLALATITIIMLMPLLAQAETMLPTEVSTQVTKNVNNLLPHPTLDANKTYKEIDAVQKLPQIGIPEAMTTIIKTILGWAMIITVIALVVMGIYYLISMGNEEDISKAKDIILYLIIGMAIIAAAYGVVAGISQFDFFNAPSQ